MKNYEELRDSLICEKNDSIDNAAHDIICTVINNKDEKEKIDAVNALLNALMPDKITLPENVIDVNELLETLQQQILSSAIVKSGDEVDWNMEHIAAIVTITENMFESKNIAVCHPYFTVDDEENENYDEDNDGTLCCLSCDRCTNCPERKE